MKQSKNSLLKVIFCKRPKTRDAEIKKCEELREEKDKKVSTLHHQFITKKQKEEIMAQSGSDTMAFLEQWVMQDGKPINVRLLSILQECHISKAHEYVPKRGKRGKG